MIYILSIIGVLILAALYRFFPNKKIFTYFCFLLIIVFCVSAFIQYKTSEQRIMTREQIEEIRLQQNIFGNWYAEYQKDIDALDRNWQLYYQIVESLKTAEIYEYSTYEQLQDLKLSAVDEQLKIYDLEVPKELDDECHILLAEVIKKTKIYSDAQVKIISAVCSAANPDNSENFDLQVLNKFIKEITIRESPAGLFTAKEISEIRDRLTVPGEGGKDEEL
ncbi:MAG: hypothetical protein IK062_00375 [Selenomonadaceae bacterium]|nr:hypothetical protein [Selenomonadaceae bacterium]